MDHKMRMWLRLENLTIGLLGLGAYAIWGQSWWMFAALILAPDLSFTGYLKNARLGAICYNVAHSYVGAGLIVALGWFLKQDVVLAVGMVWVTHIGLDRAMGYGLKLSTGFHNTHLGRIGKPGANE